jgi:hypothetical protein
MTIISDEHILVKIFCFFGIVLTNSAKMVFIQFIFMNKRHKLIVLGFFLITAIIIAIRLFLNRNGVLEGWDESIYAQLGVEFTKKPDVVLYYNNQPWVEKPFLIGLITGFIHFVTPYNKLILQSFFAIVNMLNLYFVWQLARRYCSNNITALLAPIFIVNTYLFFERASTINTDTLLVFGLLGYYVFIDKFWRKLGFLCIAVLSKSLLGFLPLFLEIVFNFDTLLQPKKIKEYLLLILLPSFWYIISYIKFGNEFLQKHFVEQIFSRASQTLESHSGEWWFYFDYFFKSSPTAIILIFALTLILLYQISQRTFNVSKIKFNQPLILGLIILCIISFSKSKLEWYLLPIIFLVAPSIPMLIEKLNKKIIVIVLVISSLFGFTFLVFTPLFSRNSKENIELIEVAKCIQKLPNNRVFVYQSEGNIQTAKKLISSNGAISSTFRYGDHPAFIYYAQKDTIKFLYNEQTDKPKTGDILIQERTKPNNIPTILSDCSTQNFQTFVVIPKNDLAKM